MQIVRLLRLILSLILLLQLPDTGLRHCQGRREDGCFLHDRKQADPLGMQQSKPDSKNQADRYRPFHPVPAAPAPVNQSGKRAGQPAFGKSKTSKAQSMSFQFHTLRHTFVTNVYAKGGIGMTALREKHQIAEWFHHLFSD